MNKTLAVSLVVAGLGIGCAVGTIAVNLVVPEARAETSPSRWEYTCEKTPYGKLVTDIKMLVDFWNKMGAQGWRKYEDNPNHVGGYTCFIREYGGGSDAPVSAFIQDNESPSN